MNYLINKLNLKVLTLIAFVLMAQSCTDDFEGLNQDKKLISDEDLAQDANDGGFLLPTMMNNIISTTTSEQTQQNLQAESYANYLEAPSNFIGNVNPTTYVTRGIWPGSWTVSTNGVMNNWVQMKKKGIDEKYPDLYAIALIIKVAAGHRLVDTFGPYPYTEYGLTAEPKWDSPQEAYAAFFVDLETAITSLQAAEAEDPARDDIRFKKWDRSSYQGDYLKWIKLANTLRLRLAIRISAADPAIAKTEAEKAVNPANGGVISDAEGSFSVKGAAKNPHFVMSNEWSDTRVSAAIITYLEGFGDPRLPVYALPGTDAALNGSYRGIRPGVDRPTKTVYENYSKYNVLEATPMKIVDVAESYFLRAEGALLGWNMGGGTAQSFYEDGVRVSLDANGVSGADEYLESVSTQIAYVDPKRSGYNSPPLSDVNVKWDEALSTDKKLEKIIMQKWIAMFPEGTEGWSEFRRTGYPKLYPIMSSKNPLLPQGTFIKRLTYPVAVVSSSQAAYDAAVAAHLDGRDDEDVKFYWMK